MALAQNNCGPQYAERRSSGPGQFPQQSVRRQQQQQSGRAASADVGPQSGTYRTVCVRTCDGFYFPISFATVPARFADDEKTCKALCPAADATLYAYRNPGEDMNQAVSINGQPYTALPNAFRYRQEFNPTCACKAAGQTWSDALKNIDDKAAAEQQGDIIVTEESAKKMSRAAGEAGAGLRQERRDAARPPPAPPPAPDDPATTPPLSRTTPRTGANKSIRTVGPTLSRRDAPSRLRADHPAGSSVKRLRRSAAGARHQRCGRARATACRCRETGW